MKLADIVRQQSYRAIFDTTVKKSLQLLDHDKKEITKKIDEIGSTYDTLRKEEKFVQRAIESSLTPIQYNYNLTLAANNNILV